jgi:arabinan endo-1,5-alpha-L-arabinosidase
LKSNYKVAVGRATSITGPYLDENGKSMMDGGGRVIASSSPRFLAAGGESVYHGKEGDIMVLHAYDAKTGAPSLVVSQIGG